MAGLSLGATELKKVAAGATEVQKISLGDSLLWQAVNAVPMGMDKTGTYTAGTSFGLVTGWAVRSGYGQTVLSGNGILLPAGTYNYVLRLTFAADNSATNNQQARLMMGSTVVATSGNGQVADVSGQVTLTEESLMTVQALSNDSFFNRAVVNAGSTNTYLYFDPVT